jgi:hypothetical protein
MGDDKTLYEPVQKSCMVTNTTAAHAPQFLKAAHGSD